MRLEDLNKYDLPDAPGVYLFLGENKEVLYVGKATSLKDRVKTYFSRDLMETRGPVIVKMLEQAQGLDWHETDSVLEALILEANEIKRLNPPANSRDKDNKSYNFVVLTKEDFPRLMVVRGRELFLKLNKESGIKNKKILIHNSLFLIQNFFGPFPHAGELKEALKIIRRIFPYRDEKCLGSDAKRPCFNYQIGLCPGVCAGVISKTEYRKTVRRISLFFQGKKGELIKDLEKEMKALAKAQKFEEAEVIKRQIFSLDHIHDVALIKKDIERRGEGGFRIEAYDIAHMGGKETVGVMTVVLDDELDKSQYRKFKVKGLRSKVQNDDTNNLKEVLSRRLNHAEWPLPNLIVVDGGIGQINAAKEILNERGFDIDVASVVKDEHHKAREIIAEKGYAISHGKSILLANSEAHRFAIGYHRKLRSKGFRI